MQVDKPFHVPVVVHAVVHYIYRVGQKTGLFLRSHNFATTDDRKSCNIEQFTGLYLW